MVTGANRTMHTVGARRRFLKQDNVNRSRARPDDSDGTLVSRFLTDILSVEGFMLNTVALCGKISEAGPRL
jgi:predicted deacylase